MKRFFSLVVIFSFFAVSAPSWAFVVTDEASCLALPASTSWAPDPEIAAGNCTLNSNLTTFSPLNVQMRFTVQSGVTLQTGFLECSKGTCRLDNNGFIVLSSGGVSMRVGIQGGGHSGVVTNAVGATILSLAGSILVEKSTIRNEGLIDNRAEIVLNSGDLINDGDILNGGTIRVECARLTNNGELFFNAPTYAYCWAGSSGAPWSNASNWNRNGVAATQPPDVNARIIIRGGRVSLDVNYSLLGSLALGGVFGTNTGVPSDLIVEPGVLLVIYGSVSFTRGSQTAGNPASVVNNSFIENYGSVTTSRLENNGTFYNHGVVKDVLINNEGGWFENGWDGYARLELTNYSTILNAGIMLIGSKAGEHRCDATPVNFARCSLNFGSITNAPGAGLDILQGLWVRDDGELNNFGVMTITKRFFDVGGLIGPGLLRIDLTSNVLNDGLINVGPIVDDGREEPPATIENRGEIQNFDTIDNGGVINNPGRICGPGSVVNNPVLGNAPVPSCNRPPTADANGPYNVDEGSSATLDGTGSSDAEDSNAALIFEWDLDNNGSFETPGVSPTFSAVGLSGPFTQTVVLRVTDTGALSDTNTTTVTIDNVAPTVTLSGSNPLNVNESGSIQYTYNYTISDPGGDTITSVTTSCGGGGIKVGGSDTNDDVSGSFGCIFPDGPASSVISASATDSDGGTGTADTQTVIVNNVAPTVIASPTAQNIQYSDIIAPVSVTGTDVIGDPLTATTTWNVDTGLFTPGLPNGLKLDQSGSCTGSPSHSCTWMLSGIANVAAGIYVVRVIIADDDGGATAVDITITVATEDADVVLDSTNPVDQLVENDGDPTGVFTLRFTASELAPDDPSDGTARAGNLNKMQPYMKLVPLGPGGVVSGVCVLTNAPTNTEPPPSPGNYAETAEFLCIFDDVEVNTYEIEAGIDGGYYSGFDEGVFVVYDPSLGFTTGGGFFYWPGTVQMNPEDDCYPYDGDKTNLGFNIMYNKKRSNIRGNLLVMRHYMDENCESINIKIKSNALEALEIGADTIYEEPGKTGNSADFGWAIFNGKATYRSEFGENEGGHSFRVYVEDFDDQGCNQNPSDQFWIEILDKDGFEVIPDPFGPVPVDNSNYSDDGPSDGDDVDIECGNIVVPHKAKRKGGGKPPKD